MSSTITGGVKFFEPSMNLEVNGATIVASSGDTTSAFAIDRNPDTKWRSAGSDDLTTESITITFDSSKTINRILLLDQNWKQFVIQYDVTGTWTDFTSVRNLSSALTGISETVLALSSSYYEFAAVTTGAIRIQVLKTQTANQEKYIAQVVATHEIGTFQGFPVIKGVQLERNMRILKTSSGRYSIQKSDETVAVSMDFKRYPASSTYNVDMDLLMQLHDRETPFLVWLCGGRQGTPYFRYTLRGYRLQDLNLMQISQAYNLSYSESITINGLNAQVTMQEHI